MTFHGGLCHDDSDQFFQLLDSLRSPASFLFPSLSVSFTATPPASRAPLVCIYSLSVSLSSVCILFFVFRPAFRCAAAGGRERGSHSHPPRQLHAQGAHLQARGRPRHGLRIHGPCEKNGHPGSIPQSDEQTTANTHAQTQPWRATPLCAPNPVFPSSLSSSTQPTLCSLRRDLPSVGLCHDDSDQFFQLPDSLHSPLLFLFFSFLLRHVLLLLCRVHVLTFCFISCSCLPLFVLSYQTPSAFVTPSALTSFALPRRPFLCSSATATDSRRSRTSRSCGTRVSRNNKQQQRPDTMQPALAPHSLPLATLSSLLRAHSLHPPRSPHSVP